MKRTELRELIKQNLLEMKNSESKRTLNESTAGDLDDLFSALGYSGGFDEFIEDNPGCTEVMVQWIAEVPNFREKLSDEFSREELGDMGLEGLGIRGYDEEDDLEEATHKKTMKEDTMTEAVKKADAIVARYIQK